MLTYKEYLILTATRTIAHLSEGISLALEMEDDWHAERLLANRLDSTKAVAIYDSPNPERVGPPTPMPPAE